MDAVSWAEVASPLVAAAGIAAVVVWAVGDRRRAQVRADEDRGEDHRRGEEERRQAQKAAAARHDVDLTLRIALAFERHQAGGSLAAAECKALLLAIRDRLPVTRFLYLGKAAWQPDDASRIEAIASFYKLPVGPDLARRELRHDLQGTPFTIYTSDGRKAEPEAPASWLAVEDHGPRHLTFKLKRAGKHAARD